MTLLAASVWLHEQRVGELRQDPRGYIELHLGPAWLESKQRPVLGQWFEERPGRRQRGARPGDLPPFFENLLPEGSLLLERARRLDEARRRASRTSFQRETSASCCVIGSGSRSTTTSGS